MLKIEFVYDNLNEATLILVWKGYHIIHKESMEGIVSDELKEKLTKRFKRKFKETNVKQKKN